MYKRKLTILSLIGICFVSLCLVGFTYGFYLIKITPNTNLASIDVTTGGLSLLYEDGNDAISTSSFKPGVTTSPKTFTVRNTGDDDISNYVVYLENVINTFSRKSDITYTLTCTSSDGTTCGGNAGQYPSNNETLITNSIAQGATHTYTFSVTYVNLNINQSIDMGKIISGKIQIYNQEDVIDIEGKVTNYEEGDYMEIHSVVKTSIINEDGTYKLTGIEPGNHTLYMKNKEDSIKAETTLIINKSNNSSIENNEINMSTTTKSVVLDVDSYNTATKAMSIKLESIQDASPFTKDTLEEKIYLSAYTNSNGTRYVSYPITSPGNVESSANEKELIKGEDDFGDTYYYRGSVSDNYVNFDNMCWRVVRIMGNSSIKLILADYSGLCNSSTTNGSTGYIYNNDVPLQTAYYKGTKSSIDYVNGLVNHYIGEFKTTNFDQNDLTKIENALWCQDYSVGHNDGNIIYYSPYDRLYKDNSLGNNQPSFKCPSGAKELIHYVSLLTVDEVAFAGSIYNGKNIFSHYLLDNSTSTAWWTLSPNRFDGTNYRAFHVETNGVLSSKSTVLRIAIRPSIILKSGQIVTGNGTIDNAYTLVG